LYSPPVRGRELRRIRKGLGLTQAALGEQLAVSANTVARWERNEVGISPAMEKLIRLVVAAKRTR